jgi:hypothetical protein
VKQLVFDLQLLVHAAYALSHASEQVSAVAAPRFIMTMPATKAISRPARMMVARM